MSSSRAQWRERRTKNEERRTRTKGRESTELGCEMDSTWQDLRFALRMLRKSPGFSATAILTFALGIGVNVAIFSVIDAAAMRPLGVAAPDRMVRILNEDAAHPDRASFSSWIEIQRFRTESTAFAGVAGADRRAVIVKQDDEARMLLANVVSDNYFDVFQVTPAAGRTFTPAELSSASAAPLMVLSYDYWQRRYNGDSSIVGQTIVASDTVCVVLGVLPRAFRGTELFLNPDVYLPLSTWLVMNPGERVKLERPQARQIEAFGRLRAGVTPAQAAAALVPIQQQLASEYPQQESGRRIEVKFDSDKSGQQVTMIGKIIFSVDQRCCYWHWSSTQIARLPCYRPGRNHRRVADRLRSARAHAHCGARSR